ncbi:hypothetical protein PUW25_08485 [Paenibacillus urinalis]|uniref:Uncharacterized protein n=1 Tax=Paenibacillus urinalis TaxID=521520 RepID=A0ABY7XGU7_9BACL|nr:hypothetical protein [Paenibacillus urinalis]WDI03971.1 hypothetical protein PUW25_08485 [Paenibacillus urinalis]
MTGVDNKLNTISKIDLIVLTAILVNVFFLRYINVFFQAFYFFDCILFLYIFANMIRTKFRIGVTFYLSIVLFTMIVGQNLLKFGIGQVAAFMKEKKKKAQIQHIPLNYHERAALRKAVEFRQSLKG